MIWLLLASFIALSIVVLLWLVHVAPVVEDELDMGWQGHSFRVTDLEPHEYRRLN